MGKTSKEISGACMISSLKRALARVSRRESLLAMAVALRGALSRMAISPK